MDSQPEPVFVDPLRSPESIPSLAGRYDNPICCTGPPSYMGYRNRFPGSLIVYKYGPWWAGTKTLFANRLHTLTESIPGLYNRVQIRVPV